MVHLPILLLLTAAPSQSAPAQVPPFRTSTRLVQINVVVHDKNGPVANLTRNDFVLTDRGKPQAIGVFSVESVSAPGAAQVLPENTFSNLRHGNASTPNAVSIILFDRLNTLTGSSAQPYEDSPGLGGGPCSRPRKTAGA